MLRWVLILLLINACARKGDAPDEFHAPTAYSIPADVAELDSDYRMMVPGQQDEWGFIDSDRCDSTLYTGLLGATGVEIRDYSAAEDPDHPGRWVRRPEFRPGAQAGCFILPDIDNGSKSSTSRDMLLGEMWYAWRHRDRSMLERIYAYVDSTGGNLGQGDSARTGLRSLRGTLVAEIAALGGEHRPFEELVSDPELFTNDSYAAHLQVLHILLNGEIYGRLSDNSKRILANLADRNDRVPLMQAAAARWVSAHYASGFLVSIRQQITFPAGRLPTSRDRCTPWFTNQSNPADALPCFPMRTHSGGDAIFAIWIYQGMPN